MRVFDIALTAGNRTRLHMPGRFFMLVDATSMDVEFIRDRRAYREKAEGVSSGYKSFPGDWANAADRFDEVVLISVANQTAQIAISERAGDFEKFLATVQIVKPSSTDDVADITVTSGSTENIAGNTDRRSLTIQADPGNADYLRVGPNAADARGHRLAPGASITFETTAQIKVHNPSGVGVSQTFNWVSEGD